MAARNYSPYGTGHDQRQRPRTGNTPPGRRGRFRGDRGGVLAPPRPVEAHGSAPARPPAPGAGRSVRRPPGGVPGSRPERGRLPEEPRDPVLPVGPVHHRAEAPGRPPAPPR